MRGQFGRLGEERGFFPREGLERVHLETRGVDKEGGREGERGGSKPAERKVDWRQGDLPRESRSRARTACSREATPRLADSTSST